MAKRGNIKKKAYVLVIIISLGTILSGCTEEKQQPTVKTIEDVAVDIVTLLMESNYTGVYSFFNSSITSQITAKEFADVWKQQVIPLHGNITKIVLTRVTNESGFAVVYVTCNFSKINALEVKISFNSEKKVTS